MVDTLSPQAAIPSVDRLLRDPAAATLIDGYGRQAVTGAVRDDLAALRRRIAKDGKGAQPALFVMQRVGVPNLTGRVLRSISSTTRQVRLDNSDNIATSGLTM